MELPPLPPLVGWSYDNPALQQQWRGPSPRSNWLVPGRVLCGDQPYTLDKASGRAGVAGAGVSTIVCLKTKAEMRCGLSAADAARMNYHCALSALRSDMKYVNFPIRDQNIADDSLVGIFVEQLLERLAAGEVLYIHCQGGHGRTGTISALLLGRLYKLSADDALLWYQRLHDMRQAPIFTGSTDQKIANALFPVQIAQVRRLLDNPESPELEESDDELALRIAACKAVSKGDYCDPAECDAAAEQLLTVAPAHPMGLLTRAVGAMQRQDWPSALRTVRVALGSQVALPPRLRQRLEGMLSTCIDHLQNVADTVTPVSQEKYPSTQHLPFSPGLGDGDSKMSYAACIDAFFANGEDVVITEKLDGGNCCIKRGEVYARTHKHPAKHPWFSTIKQLHHVIAHTVVHPHLELFGENMTATHSIVYGNLTSYLYLFGAKKRGVWCSWAEVQRIAQLLGLPTVPLAFRGQLSSPMELQSLIERLAQEPSGVGAAVKPEGFVLRLARRFEAREFERAMAKYVRANHVQTDDNFTRLYPKNKASLVNVVVPPRPVQQLETQPPEASLPLESAGGEALQPAPSPAKPPAEKRLTGRAKKEAAAAEKMRRNRRCAHIKCR